MSGRHAASRRRPVRLAWLWLLAGLADLCARLKALRPEHTSDEDELWVDGLTVRKQHGPAAPARRPQVLTVATVRAAAIPWLQHGHGYSDTTGTFTAISQEPPVLRAHESVSLTRAEVAGGLAAQQVKEWGP